LTIQVEEEEEEEEIELILRRNEELPLSFCSRDKWWFSLCSSCIVCCSPHITFALDVGLAGIRRASAA